MFNPHTNSPSTAWFQQQQQQPMMTGFNPFRQSAFIPQVTGMPAQPFVVPQPTGFASPSAQPTLQPQVTGMPFLNTQPFPQQVQATPLQPQPTGFLQPQQTGFNPFRQSMAFPSNGTTPFSTGASASPQPLQIRSPSAMTIAAISSLANNSTSDQQPQSNSPFAAALINRPASTPIGSGSGQTLKPVISHQTGSRNPFGQLKAPSPPPIPKPPTLAELSFSGFSMPILQNNPTGIQSNQQTGANQQNGIAQQNGPSQSGMSLQPFSTRLASAIGDSGSGQINSNMSTVASSFALPSDAAKTSLAPFTAQSPAPSQIPTQTTSTSVLTDSFSNLSFGTSTSTNPSSAGIQPLQPQITGFAGLKPFKPTSSFGASLVDSLPPVNAGGVMANGNGPSNASGTGVPSQNNLPGLDLSKSPTLPATTPSLPLNPQQTGFPSFSTGGLNMFPGTTPANSTGSTVGVGLRPQMTGFGAPNPFRVSTAGGGPFGGANQQMGFAAMPTGTATLSQSSFGASLFSGSSTFKPTLATIPSFTGAFPGTSPPQNQNQQQQSPSLI